MRCVKGVLRGQAPHDLVDKAELVLPRMQRRAAKMVETARACSVALPVPPSPHAGRPNTRA